MLPRILEPEVMDTPDDARDYDAMDHSGVNRLFAAGFIGVWNGLGPIVDIGTGTALIPIEFCRQSPKGNVVAIDAAQNMIALATKNIEKAGFADRIQLQLVDAKQLPFADRTWHAVMSNSIVHHIPEPSRVFQEIARVAMPGATIFIRDLFRPPDLATLQHLVRTYAGNDNDNQRKLFGESLHAALTLAEVRDLVASVGYDPSQVSQTSDRHWTWSIPGKPS